MVSLLRLPPSVLMGTAGTVWLDWQRSLLAEAASQAVHAGHELPVSAAELREFDSSVLSVLLAGARLCSEHGLRLCIHDAPAKLRELARLYGIDELLWPVPDCLGRPVNQA